MSGNKRKEIILELWKQKYSAVGIVEKLQGQVTLKEVYHTVKQNEESKEAKNKVLI